MRRSLTERFRLRRHARPPGRDAIDLLQVSARSAGGRRRVIVEVVGDVDHYTAPLLGDCLRRQCDRRGLRELVIDMDGVTFLAGAGLTILAQARRRCSNRGVRLTVRCSGRRAVLRPLQLAGLSGLVALDPGGHRSPSSRSGVGSIEPTPLVPRNGSGVPRRLPGVAVLSTAALPGCRAVHPMRESQRSASGEQSPRTRKQPWRAQ